MVFVIYTFWFCLAIVFYSYVGYGIILLAVSGIRRIFASPGAYTSLKAGKETLPEVTIVVAAYNEANIIEAKIANCLSLNYPAEKLSILFITDGSTDGSVGIIARCPKVGLLHESCRKGKTAALNRAMRYVNSPITVFCDANTMLNRSAIRRIVRHYENPLTGGVAGEKKVLANGLAAGTTATEEGLYWKYESFLKRLDAELYTVTGAAGELFSIRTVLWEPLPEDTILDDFVISTRINLNGYRIAYEPTAYACESPSASIGEEKKRKIRISAGAFQAMGLLKGIFNIFKHPILSFQFFSHRILRWTLTPVCFPVFLITNAILVVTHHSLFYELMFLAQVLFYVMALVGACLQFKTSLLKVARICYYIVFMNYSIYVGFGRFLRGRQSAIWEKAGREVLLSQP